MLAIAFQLRESRRTRREPIGQHRQASDLEFNVLSIAIVALTGLLVGWRIRTSLWDALAGFVLLIPFAYAFS